MPAGQISIALGFKGPNTAIITACATGTNCIGDALRTIQYGDADIMIAGGTEAAVSPVAIDVYKRQGKSTAEVLEKFYPASAENIENDAFIYESDIVDLTEPIRESLLLAEPLQALCRIDCQGLCPVCGADRNKGDCGCDTTTVDPRLAALKQFLSLIHISRLVKQHYLPANCTDYRNQNIRHCMPKI